MAASRMTEEKERQEIEPDTSRELKEFVEQFDDPVFGVLADPDDGSKGFWIVKGISKVRPAAVPIDQPATFDMDVLGPDGKVADEMRLTIDDIEHVRAAEPSGEPPEANDE